MADISIETANGKTTYAVGDKVTLEAKAPDGANTFAWKHGDKPVGRAENIYEFTMAADSGGEYTVSAKASDGSDLSGKITLEVGSSTSPSTETEPTYHVQFGWVAAGVLVIVGGALAYTLSVWKAHAGLSDSDWTALDGNLKVAVILGVPASVFGAFVLLVGLWMAVVEWRGRLKDEVAAGPAPKTKAATGEDVAKVIAAVGSLRGASLAMVVGAILMLGTAWVAQSAAGAPESDPSPSAAPGAASPGPDSSQAPTST